MSSRRTSSRRRRMRRNALEKKQKKLLLTGGAVVIGGVVAYALWKSTAAAQGPQPGEGAPLPPGAPSPAEKAAECAALQTSMVALRAQAEPDPAALMRLEAQIATCHA
ncbi:MAG TPA: hypothetical protein VIY27_02735, partial [Myxococcota bacterium]